MFINIRKPYFSKKLARLERNFKFISLDKTKQLFTKNEFTNVYYIDAKTQDVFTNMFLKMNRNDFVNVDPGANFIEL